VKLLVPTAAVSPCPTGQLVAYEQAEINALMVSPWNMSPDEAGQIGAAVLLVWAGAWAFRTLARLLAPDTSDMSDPR